MKEKLIKWWKNLSPEARRILRITALISGCGFLCYKAGYNTCRKEVVEGLTEVINSVEWHTF